MTDTFSDTLLVVGANTHQFTVSADRRGEGDADAASSPARRSAWDRHAEPRQLQRHRSTSRRWRARRCSCPARPRVPGVVLRHHLRSRQPRRAGRLHHQRAALVISAAELTSLATSHDIISLGMLADDAAARAPRRADDVRARRRRRQPTPARRWSGRRRPASCASSACRRAARRRSSACARSRRRRPARPSPASRSPISSAGRARRRHAARAARGAARRGARAGRRGADRSPAGSAALDRGSEHRRAVARAADGATSCRRPTRCRCSRQVAELQRDGRRHPRVRAAAAPRQPGRADHRLRRREARRAGAAGRATTCRRFRWTGRSTGPSSRRSRSPSAPTMSTACRRRTTTTEGRRRAPLEEIRRNIRAAGQRAGRAQRPLRAARAMTPVRLGAVGYLNARPLVYGLDASAALRRCASTCPSRVRAAAARARDRRRADSVDRIPARAAAVRVRAGSGGRVARAGRVGGDLHAARAARRPVDRDGHQLADVGRAGRPCCCSARFGVDARARCRWRPDLDAMLARADAALIIGDNALFLDPPTSASGAAIRKIDLGELWTELTGLPFVYAFWAGRPGALTAGRRRARCSRRATRACAQSDDVARAYYPDDAGAAGGRRRATCGIISSTILGDDERAGLRAVLPLRGRGRRRCRRPSGCGFSRRCARMTSG